MTREDRQDWRNNLVSRGASRPKVTGANREPLGGVRASETPMPKDKATNNTVNDTSDVVVENKEAENASQVDNMVSGDGWQPAVGKRGRASPSPDKVLKKTRGGEAEGLEIRNRFQKMAQDMFRGGEE